MSKPGPVSLKPPPPTMPAVVVHRRTLELERDNLRAGAIALAFSSAMGDLDARNKLAALPARLAALQLEIDLNQDVKDLAHAADAVAELEWRRAIQKLDPEDVIAGINKISCCARCTSGVSCVLTASVSYSGGECSHPIRARDLFHLNDHGKRLFRYSDHPAAARIFAAACRRLGVAKEFE
jgi:hypothetical protein